MWFPVFACFLYGECCAVVFLSVYTFYCSDKGYVARTLAVFLTVLALITSYAVVGGLGYTGQSTKSVGTIVGILADCAGICLYGAPMEKLFQVLKHKSAVFINVHMVIAGLVNNSIWLVYGILITNWFIIFINVLFVSADTFTLCLYRVYDPRTHPLQDGSLITAMWFLAARYPPIKLSFSVSAENCPFSTMPEGSSGSTTGGWSSAKMSRLSGILVLFALLVTEVAVAAAEVLQSRVCTGDVVLNNLEAAVFDIVSFCAGTILLMSGESDLTHKKLSATSTDSFGGLQRIPG
ncbi:unnamed protein product [Phytophthora lilii]|uniref:Unnamed protein product n=1 Tax=Phytophthora lilii TaxID=2077276 RepID=A0A9W7CTR9_9STRA|nr:unnamed protein product [Phytophthora lilii]